jgi:integrase
VKDVPPTWSAMGSQLSGLPPPRNWRIKILTKPEIAVALKATEGTWRYVPVLVAVTTGLRRGELFGLRRSDLDPAKSRLTVNQSLERVNKKTVFKPPKTKTSRRTISFSALTCEAFKRHLADQAEERLKLGLGKTDLVFTRRDGEPVDMDGVTKAFGR